MKKIIFIWITVVLLLMAGISACSIDDGTDSKKGPSGLNDSVSPNDNGPLSTPNSLQITGIPVGTNITAVKVFASMDAEPAAVANLGENGRYIFKKADDGEHWLEEGGFHIQLTLSDSTVSWWNDGAMLFNGETSKKFNFISSKSHSAAYNEFSALHAPFNVLYISDIPQNINIASAEIRDARTSAVMTATAQNINGNMAFYTANNEPWAATGEYFLVLRPSATGVPFYFYTNGAEITQYAETKYDFKGGRITFNWSEFSRATERGGVFVSNKLVVNNIPEGLGIRTAVVIDIRIWLEGLTPNVDLENARPVAVGFLGEDGKTFEFNAVVMEEDWNFYIGDLWGGSGSYKLGLTNATEVSDLDTILREATVYVQGTSTLGQTVPQDQSFTPNATMNRIWSNFLHLDLSSFF